MIKELKIPSERVGVLKSSLNKIRETTNTKISVRENTVTIEGEALDVWKAKDIVKAIGRGFAPEKAMNLLNDDNVLYVINLSEHGMSENKMKRVKGRIIGRHGKTRRKIEELSGSMISVYGKTVSIISPFNKVSKVKNAIEMLINGSKQNKVYNYLLRCSND